MNLNCNVGLGNGYTSSSQKARVISEAWLAHFGYCLACSSDKLAPTPRNTRARDFECVTCGHPYELKCKNGKFGNHVNDGAYYAMMHRIQTATSPSFFLMECSSTWSIINLFAINRQFITSTAIRKRKPLSPTARRAGWIGCNILLNNIPEDARIPVVYDGIVVPKEQSRKRFGLMEKFSCQSASDRNWSGALLRELRSLNQSVFTLQDAYSFERRLAKLYPENRHVREKIRQQLQVLRDAGVVTFVSRGLYSLHSLEKQSK
ncbi:MAG: DpnI domain-containing protein [Acidobacteriaceae bacterium]